MSFLQLVLLTLFYVTGFYVTGFLVGMDLDSDAFMAGAILAGFLGPHVHRD